jgi:uncharacterized membrane protein
MHFQEIDNTYSMGIETFIGSLHPAIVHIPIGLLVLYALFELVPLRYIKQKEQWQFVKTVLLVCGTLGAFGALQSGDAASEGRTKAIIGIHELVAQVTTGIFVLLTISQIVPFFREKVARYTPTLSVVRIIWNVLESYSRIVRVRAVTIVLAVAGFIALFLTGALGGAISHGIEADPATAFVVRLFGLQ